MFVCVILHKKLRNEWRCFCACVNCCILWRATRSAVRNFLCVHLSRVLIFRITCVILLLPYFCSAFVYCLFDFLNQIPCFCGFCFLWVCLSATSWVFAILPCYVLLLFVFRTFCIHYFDYDNSFCGVREVFLDLFARFRDCIFLL